MDNNNSEQVFFYERELYVCSNFSSFQVEWKGEVWMTAEHAYQAAGFSEPKIREEIKNARSAHDAMKLSKIVYRESKRKDWKDVKVGFMEDIVRSKLAQHYYVQKKLLQTGDKELIENSPRDAFWGWGPNKDGQNQLGKIWMKMREDLRKGLIPKLKEDYR